MPDHELARFNYFRSTGYVTNVLRMLVTVTKNGRWRKNAGLI